VVADVEGRHNGGREEGQGGSYRTVGAVAAGIAAQLFLLLWIFLCFLCCGAGVRVCVCERVCVCVCVCESVCVCDTAEEQLLKSSRWDLQLIGFIQLAQP
jgi:hypothetical protein